MGHASKTIVAHAPVLSIATLGGGLQDAQQATLFGPFSKQTDIHLQVQGWDGTLATLQARAQAGNDGWSLLMMEEAPLRVACQQGLLVSKPLTINPESAAPDSPGRDCGGGTWRMNLVLAWDRDRVDMTPGWTDVWDVARRPGKRGLRRDPRGTLEIALMADGVAPEDVYRTLATPEGVDRAFRKLDQLKPYIVWWNTPAEAVQIIESGAVLMTSAPNGEIATAAQAGHHRFGTQWAQSLGINVGWAMPQTRTTEDRAQAQQLLTFLIDPTNKAAFLAAYPGTPAPQSDAPGRTPVTTPASPSAAAAAQLPSDVLQPPMSVPPAPKVADDQQRATLIMDDGFWAEHLISLRQRFDGWITAR